MLLSILNGVDFVKKNAFKIFGSAWVVRSVVVWFLPEIPGVTRLARMIDVYAIYTSIFYPQTFSSVVVGPAWGIGKFVWNGCNVVSKAILKGAREAESEKFDACKRRTRALWLQCLTSFRSRGLQRPVLSI